MEFKSGTNPNSAILITWSGRYIINLSFGILSLLTDPGTMFYFGGEDISVVGHSSSTHILISHHVSFFLSFYLESVFQFKRFKSSTAAVVWLMYSSNPPTIFFHLQIQKRRGFQITITMKVLAHMELFMEPQPSNRQGPQPINCHSMRNLWNFDVDLTHEVGKAET